MAKKTTEKKPRVTKKAPAKKAPAKKAAAKKSPAKKAPAKKAAAKKVSANGKKSSAEAKVKRVQKPAVSDAGLKLADAIIKGMQDRKAKNITLLDMRKIQNRVSDFFVICDADSTTHVDSIGASVEEYVKKHNNERPYHSEGWENSQWILMDYVNVVAHVFLREVREFYNIEGLWADAEVKVIND